MQGILVCFVLTIFEKIKETKLKFPQGSVAVSSIMANYLEARVKLTNCQISKLKSAGKIKTRTILRIDKKNFQYDEFSHELFLTTTKTYNICLKWFSQMNFFVKFLR